MNMDRGKQRIVIAEFCGWKDVNTGYLDGWAGCGYAPLIGYNKRNYFEEVPDYLNDSNAMRIAKNNLSYDQQAYYCQNLFKVLIKVNGENGVTEFDKLNASPEHEAEALIKTIGKWEN